ncbi:MAG: hypothetical protein ACREO0_05505 [Pseudoxanthomonas sp.]
MIALVAARPAGVQDEIATAVQLLKQTGWIAAPVLLAAAGKTVALMADALEGTQCHCRPEPPSSRFESYVCPRCTALAAYRGEA